jgi:ABC-type transport system involved in multi-copper enzyme maturation permease subunit
VSDGLGLDGFFAGFSSPLAAVVAGVAYAAGSMLTALATLALLPNGSLALWPSSRLSAVLGPLCGGFFGFFGALVAGLVVVAYARRRRTTERNGGASGRAH